MLILDSYVSVGKVFGSELGLRQTFSSHTFYPYLKGK